MTARHFALWALLALFAAGPVAAQGVRGTAVSTARLIELRPLVTDSIAPALAGDSIFCTADPVCEFLRPGPVTQTVVFTQDVRLTAWGFGVRGLSATASLRARAHGGEGAAWPRSDDAFDAMLAYLEYDRDPVRIRAGRQVSLGGLGFASYDGVSGLYRRGPAFSAEAFVGRSLARGLAETRSEALQGFDDLVTDPSVVILGGVLTGEPLPGLGVAARYQREIFADRAGLASERASADITASLLEPLLITASGDWDFAFAHVGKANLRASLPVGGGFRVDAEAIRYVPYFELWTIWGFFDPVAWHEGAARVRWRSPDGSVDAFVSAALRRYEETNTAIFGSPIERDSRRFELDASWRASAAWLVSAHIRRETGFGASFGGGEAAVRWQPREDLYVRISGTAFDRVEEFRAGLGTVLGGGLSARVPLGSALELDGGVSLYHQATTRPASPDWTQRRAWLGLRLDFGRDPGLGSPGDRR